MDHAETLCRKVNTYKGIIVDVQTDMVKLQNDALTLREVVHHPGGVCAFAIDDDSMVTLVRQFRYPFGKPVLELPAGKLEPGEDPLAAAERELGEETGAQAAAWESLGVLYASPGISTEMIHLFLATGLRFGEAHPDPNEFLDIVRMPLTELLDLIDSGEIHDAKTIAGTLRAVRILDKRAGINTL